MASRALDFEGFLDYLCNIVREVVRCVVTDQSEKCLDSSLTRLEYCSLNLDRVDQSLPPELRPKYESIKSDLQNCIERVKGLNTKGEQDQDPYQTPTGRTGRSGRPKFIITQEQIETLLEVGFAGTEIAKLLGVSYATLKRRVEEFGLNLRRYVHVSDEQLLSLLQPFTSTNPNIGYRAARSQLQSQGYTIPYERARLAMIELNAAAVALRWGNTIKRRTYSVPSPNSLWHIDGHHKLIRWKFVVHGGIDGFSRLITYLDVAGNNRAATVCDSFRSAVTRYGLPSRRGGEWRRCPIHDTGKRRRSWKRARWKICP